MFVFERAVRFEDVDAARILYFARFFNYCHEAMEAFFGALDGGYVSLVVERKIGLPTAHIEADFRSPLRFGDVARIHVGVLHVGKTSCTFGYDWKHGKTGEDVAKIRHVCVTTLLDNLKPVPIPSDIRQLLETHRVDWP